MGILDALFGRKDDDQQQPTNPARAPYGAPQNPRQVRRERPQNADEQALARYRYMLQTAPPEQIEAAHEEAFSRLTPEQRQMALQQMTEMTPANEAGHLSENPRDLARAATRAEMRQPGAMQRMFGGANATGQNPNQQNNQGQGMMGGGGMGGMMGGGMMGGMGGMMAGSLLTSLAGGFIGSSIANSFFNNSSHEQGFQSSPEAQAVDGGVSDYNGGDYNPNFEPTGLDSSADPYGDPEGGMQDAGLDSSADPYGDPGADSGGFDNADFGGGDFGGGDFGGGDF